MQPFLQFVASNALLVVVLAVGVALLGRFWKNPLCLHLLWVLVLLKLVTPPVVIVPLSLPARQAPLASEEPAANPSRVEVARQETASTTLDRGVKADSPLFAETKTGTVPASPAPDVGAVAIVVEDQGMPWPTVLGWTWGVGIVVFASGRACRIVRFRRLLQCGEAPSSAVLDMADGIATRLGLRRIPQIRMLPVRVSPLVWSLGGRPRVFLPAALFERLDGAEQEAILAHELAHVRRKDHWVRLLELAITTLFWWHPVVWWAARQLQELEDQCCDAMVVGMSPHGAKSYATALLDTLDFLSDRAMAAPLGATAAKSSISMARRITMLKNRTSAMRLTIGRLALLAAVAAVPMALAFAAKPPQKDDLPPADGQKPAEKPVVERRAINKLVKDFPEKTDLSTPESAAAAYHRAAVNPDPKASLDLSAWKYDARDLLELRMKSATNKADAAKMNDAYLNAEIIEVNIYRDGLTQVIAKLKFPEGVGRDPYSSRTFVRINGQWKNFGEDRLPGVEEARKRFDEIKGNLWINYGNVLEGIKNGKPVMLSGERPKRSAPIAPGQPLGISVEKADLMGRIEWAFMHGARDITARKSIEWGDIQKDKDGNRTIRYKFYATIWDKDVLIFNQVFTFDAKGNILNAEDLEGFPQKKVVKPADVTTQAGMKALVEDFFSKNFVDVTSRETIEWGEVEKTKDGNSSIRYKYRATIWDRDAKIMNQVFTFDPKGKYVSFKNVEGFPQVLPGKPADVATQAGMKDLVEDFFAHNFRDIKARETIEWGELTKAEGGNVSIRYKYRTKIWNRDAMIMNQVFTFDPQGKFVSYKNVEGFPQKP